jgi:hypothetical protein
MLGGKANSQPTAIDLKGWRGSASAAGKRIT